MDLRPFHPWLDEQGHSSFVWAVIGAISQVTSLPVTTAVTCTTRIHPAIIAQAAATASLLTGGRFTLGVGTGEALNEHVTGEKWPPAQERREIAIRAYQEAGLDEVYLGQAGGRLEGAFELFATQLLPRARES